MDGEPERLGSRVGVAQHPGADVDGVDLRIGEGLGVGHGGTSSGAADVENALGPEVGVLLLQVFN